MSTPSEIAGIVIVGGGVIGTAIAAEVSQFCDDVFLIEARHRLGLGSSTRNSGVIHAGIYYEPGSLKAFHCVRGREMLYELCCAHGVPHKKTGKLIVGDDVEELHLLKQRGDENGVDGLLVVESDFIRELEPNVAGSSALYSPETGIIDAEALLRVLEDIATANGAHLLPGTPLLTAEVKDDLVHLGTPRETVKARIVINAAGLFADEVAAMFGFDQHRIYPCRGEYAEVVPSRRGLVNGLVYPLPLQSGHGLGVHFTRTTAGALLVGPNSRYVDSKDDYENDRLDLDYFYEAGREMVPALRLEDLRLSYSGLRSRLRSRDEHTFADFVIERDPVHHGVIHLIGMESPGLTSCLSIARSVGEMIKRC
jgi:glycerol-3-phosphate dehydrogenase